MYVWDSKVQYLHYIWTAYVQAICIVEFMYVRVEDLKQVSTDKKPQQQAKSAAKPKGAGPLTAFRDTDSHSSKLVRSDAAKPPAKKGAKFTDEELKILM